jgi:hydroxyquinol 1,2-dioxygenase
MDRGHATGADQEAFATLRAFEARLHELPPSRLRDAIGVIVSHLHHALWTLRPNRDEVRALFNFLTDTGHYADSRRQEWVLLADALGLSSAIEDINTPRPAHATPETGTGAFYRPDAPPMERGQTISRDGRGTPLLVTGTVTALDGGAVPGATVEVWQANADGLYENQEPDRQPEHNLRGRFVTDAQGQFRFLSVKPSGYSLPAQGPAGRLLQQLGLPLARPAHINLRISARGFDTLSTHIFDRADTAIDQDAIFAVRPALLADFNTVPSLDGKTTYSLDINLVLCPMGSAQTMPARSS